MQPETVKFTVFGYFCNMLYVLWAVPFLKNSTNVMSSKYNVTGYPTTDGTSTVLFIQRLWVSFIQELVTVYQTRSTTPKEPLLC